MSIINKYCKTEFNSYEEFYNNFKIDIPENFNFAYDIMDEQARTRPNDRALYWCNDQDEVRVFTFADLKRLSDKAANVYKAHGIKKGDFVMTMLKRNYEYWISALALCKIGAILVPATHMLTVKDIVYRVRQANIKAIFSAYDTELLDNILEAKKDCGDVLKTVFCTHDYDGFINFDAELEEASETFERPTGDEATKNDDHMLLYFTSGTSGMPKMVIHNFVYPLGHILTAKFWHRLDENDLHLSVADTGWAKCSWGKIYGQWICGACIFVYDYGTRFMPVDLLKMIERHHVTVFCAPPTVFRFLIKENIEQYDLSSLRHCATAGEPLNPEVFNRWKEITGLEIKEGFGQTETAVIIATYKNVESRPGSTGKFAPHFKTVLLKDDGTPADIGDEGEICIDLRSGHPAGLFLAYYKDEARTSDAFREGFYHTGDMAWQDEDGYVWFVGRSDDVIKSSGYRIGPFEVESALLEHPAVLETAITAVPHPVRGQIVKATIVLTKGYTPSDELKVELQEHVKRVTAPYKYPRIIEFVDELPKTYSGKIRRAQIRTEDMEK